MTILDSNAKKDGVLSKIRKKKTCFRPNFDRNKTIDSLVTVKLEMNSESVVKVKFDDGSIKQATQNITKNILQKK